MEFHTKLHYYKFWLGCSPVSGWAKRIDDSKEHVLRLEVDHGSPLEYAILSILSWLPLMVQAWIRAWFPGPFLPNTVIIKKLKSPDWKEEFDNEIRIYKRLKTLQGRVVPVAYGETSVDGTRALVLEDVGGGQLGAIALNEGEEQREDGDNRRGSIDRDICCYSDSEIESMLREAFQAMLSLGVWPDDADFCNCLVANGRVMMVDHEQDEVVQMDENLLECLEEKIEEIMGWYKRLRATGKRQRRVRLGKLPGLSVS